MTLVVKNITNSIISNISFEVTKSDILVITGPSGAGKTTILRIIAGLEKMNSGIIVLNGREIQNVPAHTRNIAMLFQESTLFPHLRVKDNIAFPLKHKNIKRREREKEVLKIAEMLGISSLLERYSENLSGGEKQRVSLGRILIQNPKLLMLDEPLTYLDIQNQYILRDEIRFLHKELNIPIIYVTHNQSEALVMATKMGVLFQGTFGQIATPQEIYNNPITLQIAKYIGIPPINVFEGIVKDKCFSCAIFSHIPCNKNISGKVYMAIRPENIIVQDNGIECRVKDIEFQGNGYILFLKSHNHTIQCYHPCHNSKIRKGDNICIAFHKENLLFFDGGD